MRIPEYKRQPGSPSATLFELLLRSPEEMLDMITVTCKACRACGVPPAVPSGKELLKACYEVYCEDKASPPTEDIPREDEASAAAVEEMSPEQKQAEKQEQLHHWGDSCEAMESLVQLVFFKAREHLEQEHSEEGGGSSGNALPPPMKVKTAGELAAGGGSDGDGDEDEDDDDDWLDQPGGAQEGGSGGKASKKKGKGKRKGKKR